MNIKAKRIIPFPDTKQNKDSNIRENVYMPFLRFNKNNGVKRILLCGTAKWSAKVPERIIFEVEIDLGKTIKFVYPIASEIFELPKEIQLEYSNDCAFVIKDDLTIEPLEEDGKLISIKDVFANGYCEPHLI